jgi:hypothetical protein
MSDVMLFGVLRMPYDLAMYTELSRAQFYERTQEAADTIEFQAAEIAKLTAERDAMRESLWKCRGIEDSVCQYLAHCHTPCNKCGKLHDAARAQEQQ